MLPEPYVLRVITDKGDDAPSEKTHAVISEVRRLFREICRNVVKGELRLQGDVPPELYENIGLTDDRHLAQDTRRLLDETLDYLGGTTRGTWMCDTYPDPVGRKRIASSVLAIWKLLNGDTLIHGYGNNTGRFSDSDLIWITGMANSMTLAHPGGIMGVIVKDPDRRDHWAISDGELLIPLVFKSGYSRYDIDDLVSAGPVIAMGTVIRDSEDRIIELRSVENCYTVPGIVFLRAIGTGRDKGLVYPLEAIPAYYDRQRTWYLRCPDLALESSADNWRTCVMDFHERFLDLWDTYVSDPDGINARMRDILDSMRSAHHSP